MKKQLCLFALSIILSFSAVAPLEAAPSTGLKAILKKKFIEKKALTSQDKAALKKATAVTIAAGLAALGIVGAGWMQIPPKHGTKYQTRDGHIITVEQTYHYSGQSMPTQVQFDSNDLFDLDESLQEVSRVANRIYDQGHVREMPLTTFKKLIILGDLKEIK